MSHSTRRSLVFLLPLLAIACGSSSEPASNGDSAEHESADAGTSDREDDIDDLVPVEEVANLDVLEMNPATDDSLDDVVPLQELAHDEDSNELEAPDLLEETTPLAAGEGVDLSVDLEHVESTSSASGSLAWYARHTGSRKWEGLCLRAAANSYGHAHAGFSTAYSLWLNRVKKHVAHRNQKAPKGALVFWKTSANGHVGVADGKGGFWSSSVHGHIGHAKLPHFQHYLGWAPKPW